MESLLKLVLVLSSSHMANVSTWLMLCIPSQQIMVFTTREATAVSVVTRFLHENSECSPANGATNAN